MMFGLGVAVAVAFEPDGEDILLSVPVPVPGQQPVVAVGYNADMPGHPVGSCMYLGEHHPDQQAFLQGAAQ